MTSFKDGPWGCRRETPAGLTWVALSSSVLHSRGFTESETTEMGGHVVWKGLLQVGLTRLSRAKVLGDDVAMPKKYPLEFKKDMAGARTFFKPDPALHGYPTNWDCWLAQPGEAP